MYAPAVSNERSARVWGALIAVYLIWGSTFLAIRVALEGFPALLVSPLRFTLAGAVLFLGLLARGDPLPRRREWLNSIVTGAIFCGSNGLLVIGEQSVSSGLAAVVLASIPLWGALFAGVFGRWPSQREWAGLAVGFAGMVLLNVGTDLRASPFGAIALLSSAAIWALSSTWSRRLQLPQGLMSPAAQMLGGGAVLLLIALAGGERPAQVPSSRAISALVYLTVAGSIVGYSAFSFLARSVRPALAFSYAYVNPLIAVALGIFVAGEHVRPATLGGLALVLAGVSAIVRSG